MDGGSTGQSNRGEIQRDIKRNRKLRARRRVPSPSVSRSTSAIDGHSMTPLSLDFPNLEQLADNVLPGEPDEPYFGLDDSPPIVYSATQLRKMMEM